MNKKTAVKIEDSTTLSDSEEKKCYICYESLEKGGDIVKLSCGHEFHYNCIYMTYVSMNINKYYIKKKRECPYCRCDGGYLELKQGYMPQKHINREFNELEKDITNNNFEKWEKYLNKDKCFYYLKSGKNMGKQCSRKYCDGHKFCKTHLKILDKNQTL